MMERVFRSLAVLGAAGALACSALPCSATHSRRSVASAHTAVAHRAKAHVTVSRASASRGVVKHVSVRAGRGRHAAYVERAVAVRHEPAPSMDSVRAAEIQAALIRAGYLSGEPTGVWDADSVSAMQKLQDENGWQTKYTPDSRALVKLGLGATPFHPGQPTLSADTSQGTPAAQP